MGEDTIYLDSKVCVLASDGIELVSETCKDIDLVSNTCAEIELVSIVDEVAE